MPGKEAKTKVERIIMVKMKSKAKKSTKQMVVARWEDGNQIFVGQMMSVNRLQEGRIRVVDFPPCCLQYFVKEELLFVISSGIDNLH